MPAGTYRRRSSAQNPRILWHVSQPVRIPSGTITLLFTDVEGSTKLWETEPELMAQALRRHDEILRAAIEQAGGFVFKTVGDAFCAAFATPQAALAAVLDAQQALCTERWPTSQAIRVRMGMHTGVSEERDNDYFGPVVNRTARLNAIAHGGQVLVSGATAELLSETLPESVALRDLRPRSGWWARESPDPWPAGPRALLVAARRERWPTGGLDAGVVQPVTVISCQRPPLRLRLLPWAWPGAVSAP